MSSSPAPPTPPAPARPLPPRKLDPLAALLSVPLELLGRIFAPVIWLLQSSAGVVARLFGVDPAPAGVVSYTREDILHSVAAAEDVGAIEQAEEERDRAVGSRDLSLLATLAGPAAEERWEAMTVHQRRAVLEALHLRVVIDRAGKGPTFRPETVRFIWG